MCSNPGPVLIVDDDAAVRNSLKFALELEGLNVRLYESAQELLSDRSLPRDGCLVVDYLMPVMNGIDLVQAMRREERCYPSILIAGKLNDDIRRRARLAGVRTILEKPLSDEALIEAIRSALDTSSIEMPPCHGQRPRAG